MQDKINKQYKNADDLIDEAILYWERTGDIDNYDRKGVFLDIEKDPVFRLIMSAFAHQINSVKNEINNVKSNILYDFFETSIPHHFIKAKPSFALIQTSNSKNIDYDCCVSEETPFIIERETLKNRTKEKFQFIPLLKTKIINASIVNVEKIERNQFKLNFEFENNVNNLSFFSFCVFNNKSYDLSVSINNITLPLIKPKDFHNLPWTDWFCRNNIIINNSLMYGTVDYWAEIFIRQQLGYYLIDEYDSGLLQLNNNSVEIQFNFISDNEIDLNIEDVVINCFPAVNIEKHSVTLSNNDPIKKIADNPKINSNDDPEISVLSHIKKQFLNIIISKDKDNSNNIFTIRRFGVERYNRNELLNQINDILNRFVTDYYAFKSYEGLKDGSKLKRLNQILHEIIEDIDLDTSLLNGTYLILNHPGKFNEQDVSYVVDFLLTDGAKANGIDTDALIRPSIEFDKNTTRLINATSGGKDEIIDKDEIKQISQYYFLTKDKLVTKSDIKFFCLNELINNHNIEKRFISNIDVKTIIKPFNNSKQRLIEIVIKLKSDYSSSVNELDIDFIANTLKEMIEMRSISVHPILVNFVILSL
jgi:hypothetical protein